MPNRVVREGILTSERVNRLSLGAELLYRRLLSVVDDYGRFFSHESLILAACFPLRVDSITPRQVREWLKEVVETAGLVVTYEVNGTSYLEVQDFRQHKRAMKSKFPSPAMQLECNCTPNEHERREAQARGAGERREAQEPPTAAPVLPKTDDVLSAWREVCVPAGLPDVRALNDGRKRKVQIRVHDETFRDNYRDVFARIAGSNFCRGQNDRGWVASFDWIIANGDNYLKVLEGKYDNRGSPQASLLPIPAGQAACDAAFGKKTQP